MTLLDDVRRSCARVAERATRVTIDESQLVPFARALAAGRAAIPGLDPRHHYLGHGDATLAYIVTLDAINFGSGYFPHLHKLPGLSGYFTIATRLKEHFLNEGPLDAKALLALRDDDCLRIFHQAHDLGPRTELMSLFARALRQLGSFLRVKHGGEFVRLVAAADRSAAKLVEVLAQMPFFRDVETYDELEVSFYKRAQLMSADLSLAGVARFDDLDRLTIFADNLVPHVLRLDGVLRYEPALVERIEAGELIPSGSPEEVEIRACAVHAVDRLVAQTRAIDAPMTAAEIDYVLWTRGQRPDYKARPRHRTRTVFY
jgi:putative queuosine salvage protein